MPAACQLPEKNTRAIVKHATQQVRTLSSQNAWQGRTRGKSHAPIRMAVSYRGVYLRLPAGLAVRSSGIFCPSHADRFFRGYGGNDFWHSSLTLCAAAQCSGRAPFGGAVRRVRLASGWKRALAGLRISRGLCRVPDAQNPHLPSTRRSHSAYCYYRRLPSTRAGFCLRGHAGRNWHAVSGSARCAHKQCIPRQTVSNLLVVDKMVQRSFLSICPCGTSST